jgi:tripartite-type tricarboxylate transporter receptor subunit TctC
MFVKLARTVALGAAALLPALASAAYPDKPIRIVVPYSAGGPTDAMARILQGALQKDLGVPLIIDNVAGAGGALGAQQVLRAPADGYTLFLGNNGPSAVTPLLQKNAAFDPVKDFVPVSLIAKATMTITISSAVPATDMKSFLAYAKSHPGALNFASAGIGSLGHLGSELFAKDTGLQMTHIPYKGQAPTLQALMMNDVQMLLTTPTDAMRAQVTAGRIKLIGVTSDKPSPFDPKADVVQQSVPGFVLYSWFAFMAKAGTPEPVLAKLHAAINAALATEEVQKRFAGLGIVAEGGPAQDVTALVKQDLARWAPIIRDRKIEAE